MRIEIVSLTPAKATEWRERIAPDKQRKLREHHVQKLAGIIRRGEWKTNNDMFMFDMDGNLANGQHRAVAVSVAGKTVKIVVAWDCTEDQVKVADQGGLPRRTTDALHYEGFDNTTNLASIINTIKRDVEGERFAPSSTEAIAFAERHHDKLRRALTYWHKCTGSRCPVEPSIVCAVWFVASEYNEPTACAFADAVSDSMPAQRGDAVWVLLKRFKESKDRLTGRMTRGVKTAIVIKAYNYFKAGVRPPFLRWSPGQGENFPTVK